MFIILSYKQLLCKILKSYFIFFRQILKRFIIKLLVEICSINDFGTKFMFSVPSKDRNSTNLVKNLLFTYYDFPAKLLAVIWNILKM